MKNEKTANDNLDFIELIRKIDNNQLLITIEIHKIKIAKDTLLIDYYTHLYETGEEPCKSDEIFKEIGVMRDKLDKLRKAIENFDKLRSTSKFCYSNGFTTDILTSFK